MKIIFLALAGVLFGAAQTTIGVVTDMHGRWKLVKPGVGELHVGSTLPAGAWVAAQSSGELPIWVEIWVAGAPAVRIDCADFKSCTKPVEVRPAPGLSERARAVWEDLRAVFFAAPRVYVPAMSRGGLQNAILQSDPHRVDLTAAELPDGEFVLELRAVDSIGQPSAKVVWTIKRTREQAAQSEFRDSTLPAGLYELSASKEGSSKRQEDCWVLAVPAARSSEFMAAFENARKEFALAKLSAAEAKAMERVYLIALLKRLP